MLTSVTRKILFLACEAAFLLAALAVPGCKKEEQVVANVANTAATAQKKAQAASAEREQQRAEMAKIVLPTKSRYIDVHEPGAWSNPFISFDAQMINLRVTMTDANPSALGQGGLLRPTSARRNEVQIKPEDLVKALIALPPGAWPYGRVVAIEESPLADRKARPAIRRQMEAAIAQLNDLGVVVDEWPAR